MNMATDTTETNALQHSQFQNRLRLEAYKRRRKELTLEFIGEIKAKVDALDGTENLESLKTIHYMLTDMLEAR